MPTLTPRRPFVFCALAAVLTSATVPAALAQVERVADSKWTHPRTADGQPDLQGMWGDKTITPMERPDSAQGKAFLTREEGRRDRAADR